MALAAAAISDARTMQDEAANLAAANRQWIENGRALQRIIEQRRRSGLQVGPAVRRLLQQWEAQGRYLRKVTSQVAGDDVGLGLLPLLIIGGGALVTAVSGIFTARKAIGVQEQKAAREAQIIAMVEEGQITPEIRP